MNLLKLLFTICLLQISIYASIGHTTQDFVIARDLDKARQHARSTIADIATISDIEQSAKKFTDTLVADTAKEYSLQDIERLKHEIRQFYLDAKMQGFIKETTQNCRKMKIARTNMDTVDHLTKKQIAQLGIPNDPAYQPIIHTAQEELKKIISELPARMPLTASDRRVIAIQKARQYASSHLASISTIDDIEQSKHKFADSIAAEHYSPELIEELKHEIQQFYLDAKMLTIIRHVKDTIQQMKPQITYLDDPDNLTKQLTQHWHIPSEPAYQPILTAIQEELEQLIKDNYSSAQSTKRKAEELSTVPQTFEELISITQQFQRVNNLSTAPNHQLMSKIFRDTLKKRMSKEAARQRTDDLNRQIQKSINATRGPIMTSQEIQELHEANQEDQDLLIHFFWIELLRNYGDQKLNLALHNISLETLSPENLDKLIKKTKQEILEEGQLIGLTAEIIDQMQKHIETSLRQAVQKKYFLTKQATTTKRSVTIAEKNNTVFDIHVDLEHKFQHIKRLLISLKGNTDINQNTLDYYLNKIFSNVEGIIITPNEFITSSSVPNILSAEALDKLFTDLNILQKKLKNKSTNTSMPGVVPTQSAAAASAKSTAL